MMAGTSHVLGELDLGHQPPMMALRHSGLFPHWEFQSRMNGWIHSGSRKTTPGVNQKDPAPVPLPAIEPGTECNCVPRRRCCSLLERGGQGPCERWRRSPLRKKRKESQLWGTKLPFWLWPSVKEVPRCACTGKLILLDKNLSFC